MIGLTVGYVSGIIAAVIFILQFLIPNALIVILVGVLGSEHTNVTWSVVERNLVSSLWPLFLRADSTASRGVDRSIRFITWLRPLGLGLVTIAAVVTPLGLYDAIEPSRRTIPARMAYVSDPSPFGYGTPPRPTEGFVRTCGDFVPLQCPGTTVVIDYEYTNDTEYGTTVSNATIPGDNYDVRIPKILGELYQSGLSQQSQSVSSFFDIQARTWGWTKQKGTNSNKQYPVDGFQMLESVILNDALEVREGVVIDTITGAIGFRNHTVPSGVGLGAEWSEDLLFLEPETECVNLNLSLEFKAPYKSISKFDLVNISLVDDGGFSDKFVTEYPHFNLSDGQEDPQLSNRAYKAAWMTNAYSMLTMNLTRPSPDAFGYMKSKVGDRYTTTTDLTWGVSLNSIYITNLFQFLMDPEGSVSNYSLVDAPGANYSNQFEITSTNYSDVSVLCQGTGGMDYTNMSNIHVECGLVFGAAHRKDGHESLTFEPGAWYSQPIYSCASTTKASIKTVAFKYNATLGEAKTHTNGPNLGALSVQSIRQKDYPTEASMPLWGVETVDYYLHDLVQLWGLISPERAHDVNLTTKRSPHLYLPGYGGILSSLILGYEFMPGTSGPASVLSGLYDSAAHDGSSQGIPDYSGSSNMAMLSKWRQYSRNETTVSRTINMIWTDIAANMLVGTRNWNTQSELPPHLQKRGNVHVDNGDSVVPVTVLKRQIRYRWCFAIPALLSLALVVLISIAAFLLMVFGGSTPFRIDHYLKNLSSGRLLGAAQYPAEDKVAPTKAWIKQVGRRQSNLHKHDGSAYEAPSPSIPFFAQTTAYPQKSPGVVDHQALNGGSPPKGGYARVDNYDKPADEIFGQAH